MTREVDEQMTQRGERHLIGRATERGALRQVCADLRSGSGRALVLRGEPGVGKTALLDWLFDEQTGSADAQVVRVRGVASDMDLTYAALQQVCAPLLDHLKRLPDLQQQALTVAFGRGPGPQPDRFLVGLAVVELMAAAAAAKPVLCIVDDAQWVDDASLQALVFVARRLPDAPLALLFGVRCGTALPGLPELTVGRLNDCEAGELFDALLPGPIDPRVRDRIVGETRGNPRALHALPATFAAAEVAGGFTNPRMRLALTNPGVTSEFPEPTRRLLLVAAAEPTGDPLLLARAADILGIGLRALAPAETAGLVEMGARVWFREPYLRTVIYRTARLDERRTVHRALAQATDATLDPARRAWHAANAANGPDETVATQLQEAVVSARDTGGVVAAAAFWERATALTADPARRAARALAAAEAKYVAREHSTSLDLLGIAEAGPLGAAQRALATRLRLLLDDGPASALLDVAHGLGALDTRAACEVHRDALAAAISAGRSGEAHILKEAAESARSATARDEAGDLLLDALATRIACGPSAIGPLRRALSVSPASLWPTVPMLLEAAVADCWDDDAWHAVATALLQDVRHSGALALLPEALGFRAGLHLQSGEFSSAAELLAEASDQGVHAAMLAAWRGDVAETTRLTEGLRAGRAAGAARHAVAVLNNGLGRYDVAFAAAQQACEYEDLGFYGGTLVELIEAGTRCGQHDSATEALYLLEERTTRAGTAWAAAALAGGRALLSSGRRADGLHRESIEHYERTRLTVQAARARLRYGEWLRRANRRPDAVRELTAAHEVFVRMGARAFAERARRELVAAGRKARAGSGRSGEQLTAQETQIAGLAARGLTNQEIAAQLFISPHTVEWHLRKVFVKLGITSRRQLRTHGPRTTGFQGSAPEVERRA
ncbi:AAA family ATPase [Mycolicibacterium smegmatis]|nr:AAA family ATPase [Mycolicibacterium smegmatis]